MSGLVTFENFHLYEYVRKKLAKIFWTEKMFTKVKKMVHISTALDKDRKCLQMR